MLSRTSRFSATLAGLMLLACAHVPAFAQNPEPKQADPKTQGAGDPNKDEKRRIDEFAEATRVLGGPAANPECVWLGRRVVNLLWRDDLDTAFRHLDLYDRFGCPSGHIQATFRCVVRQGPFDPKAAESLYARVHSCWINPAMQPQAAAAPAAPAANPQARAPAAANPQ
jgi:hypothetical protein